VLGLGIVAVLVALLLPAVRRAPEAGRRSQCKSNLKMIGLALHNYHEDYDAFPPAYTVDAQGKPLHSWRTLILPYLDQRPLYEKIDLSKPWNAPENSEAFQTRVAIYSCPSTNLPRNHTTYLASAGPSACFHDSESRRFSDITDGASNTLMVIEVPLDRSVPWMSPQDADEQLILSIGAKSKLGHEGGIQAALCDGAVRFINHSLPIETRRALISIAGGDKVGEF
jgi:hypothetical protein